MKRLVLIALLSTFASTPVFASKIIPIEEADITPPSDTIIVRKKKCTVEVFKSRVDAEIGGQIIEKCVIKGTSSGSWTHTVENAIKKHAADSCKCGGDKAYVLTSQPMTMYPAKVTLVAFKYGEVKQKRNTDTTHYINELEALANLRDDGIITEVEFQKQKAKILARE